MRRRSNVAVLITFVVLAAVLHGRPTAAQGVAEDYIPAPAFGGVPRFSTYTKAPELLNRSDVERALVQNYPAALRQRGEGGNVMVWLLIDERGEVMSARVKRPSGKPALDAGALRVTSSMHFSPGLDGREPVKVWVALPVIFLTRDEPPRPATRPGQLRPGLTPWGTPPAPFTDVPTFEPSSPLSLLNARYIMRAVRDTFAARFKDGSPQGTTTLSVHVNIAGDAAAAEIARSSGNPALDSLALSFRDRFVFVPAIEQGRYARATTELQIRFPPKVPK